MRRSMIVGLFILLVLGLTTPVRAQATQTTEAFVSSPAGPMSPRADRSATWWSFMAPRPWTGP